MPDSLIEPEPVGLTGKTLELKLGPLGSAPPRPTDVVQGQIGACPIAAVMVAMAHARPDLVTAMLGSPKAGPILSMREGDEIFNLWSDQFLEINFPGRGRPTPVTPWVYFDGQDVEYAATPTGPGWPSYIEKAYAVWKSPSSMGLGGSYSRLELTQGGALGPPTLNDVMNDLIGRIDVLRFVDDQLSPLDAATLTNSQIIRFARDAGRLPTVAPSLPDPKIARFNIIPKHGYAVLGSNSASLVLRNPHGGQGARQIIPINHCRKAFHGLWQFNP